MKCKSRHNGLVSPETRIVNFVIYVANGVSVLKSMDGDGEADKDYSQMIAATFNCPYLSFKGINFSSFTYSVLVALSIFRDFL